MMTEHTREELLTSSSGSGAPVKMPVVWTVMTMRLWARLERARDDERGQGLVEYALIIMLVALVVIGGLAALGADIAGLVTRVTDAF